MVDSGYGRGSNRENPSHTAICVLIAGLHSVMRMTNFKYAIPHSYSMLRYLATFPCGAVPFTAEEERPPDLSCDGAAKKYEYVRVNRIRLRISHPSIVVAAVGGQVIETKLRSLDGLSKKKTASDHSLMGSSVILFLVRDMS
ncbi:unnamed protein product [Brassica oleracea var. botrytis]